MDAFKPLLELRQEIDHLTKSIESHPDIKKIEKLSSKQTEFEIKGGYAIQSKTEEILEGIGFKTTDLTRPMGEFSGGWKMRVLLAKLLLEKPALLLLDEPTNHLDLPSIQWFENYIRNYDGAVIIVSHDQSFLDNTINKIIEIDQKKINQYNGNYSLYIKEKKERLEIQQNAYVNQQKKIKQAEKFINRFRAKASKARQVQSKIKLMDKIDLIENASEETKTIDFEFRFSDISGKQVLEIEHVSKAYDDLEIFRHTSSHIIRGDKIALIGANGLGKTTLLKMISGNESFSGKITRGHRVIPAYYAQHQVESLNYRNTVLEELIATETGYTELELRTLLGSFLFTGEDVFKKIAVLSGGEKARVALAKTLLSKSNFLVLDEPTNHLDIYSVEILTDALRKYKGTLVMVSHDRQFINSIANKIWYIENKQIKEYPGSLDEYIYWFNNLKSEGGLSQKPLEKKPGSKENKNISWEKQKERKKQFRALRKEIDIIESQIEKLEYEKNSLETEMAKTEIYSDFEKLEVHTSRLIEVKNEIERLHPEWEKAIVRLDSMGTEDL
jgi:ATP-binding cassette subfamily F protein 3